MKFTKGTRVLVAGASGMLGRDVIEEFQSSGVSVITCDLNPRADRGLTSQQVDITDQALVGQVLEDECPAWVVNCAAYTKVDLAESEVEQCHRVNATAVAGLAAECFRREIALLHISTDYVFGGEKGDDLRRTPYREDDYPAPCGVYGKSKFLGEQAIVAALPGLHLILRTSWLHGRHGPNFIATILRLAQEAPELRIVNDQRGSPTYSRWLAGVIVELIARNARGVFHATSRGDITWYDFAVEILAQAGLKNRVVPQTTSELNRPAPRPAYSTLDLSRLENFLGQPCISWKDGLTAHLKVIAHGE